MSSINLPMEIRTTCYFGKKEENQKIHDIRDTVGKSILDYRLIKIKCQIKSGIGIYGLQLLYKNLITNEDKFLINIKSKEPNLIEQEMALNIEFITDLKIYINDDIKLIGFEAKTNRGNFKKFGYGNIQDLRKCHELKNNDKAVIGFGFAESQKNGIIGMNIYYTDKLNYIFLINIGIFRLRIKAKNDENKNELVEKANKSTDEIKKLLFKVCCLPDNQFFEIIKFTIS